MMDDLLIPPEVRNLRLRRRVMNRLLLVAKWRNDDPKLERIIKYLRRNGKPADRDLSLRIVWAFLTLEEIEGIRTGAPVKRFRPAEGDQAA